MVINYANNRIFRPWLNMIAYSCPVDSLPLPLTYGIQIRLSRVFLREQKCIEGSPCRALRSHGEAWAVPAIALERRRELVEGC